MKKRVCEATAAFFSPCLEVVVAAVFWLAGRSADSTRRKAADNYWGFQNQIKECFILISFIKAFFKCGAPIVGK